MRGQQVSTQKKKKKSDLLCARWVNLRPHLLPCVCHGCGGGDFGCDAGAVVVGSQLKTYEKTCSYISEEISVCVFFFFFITTQAFFHGSVGPVIPISKTFIHEK